MNIAERHDALVAENEKLEMNLTRANKIIGWMMPHIGGMGPPDGGLMDLNEHCMANRVPEPGEETKGAPLRQRAMQ